MFRSLSRSANTISQILPIVAVLAFLAVIVVSDRDFMQLATKKATALSDIRSISSALSSFLNVSGSWPNAKSYLYTDGLPAISEETFGPATSADHISAVLSRGNPRAADIARSQLRAVGADPWGRRYVILIWPNHRPNLSDGWVISAGPNGILETAPNSMETSGDDIGIPLR